MFRITALAAILIASVQLTTPSSAWGQRPHAPEGTQPGPRVEMQAQFQPRIHRPTLRRPTFQRPAPGSRPAQPTPFTEASRSSSAPGAETEGATETGRLATASHDDPDTVEIFGLDGVDCTIMAAGLDLGAYPPGHEFYSEPLDGVIFSPTGTAEVQVLSDTSVDGLAWQDTTRREDPPNVKLQWQLRERVDSQWTDWRTPDTAPVATAGQCVCWVIGDGEPLPRDFQLRVRVTSEYMQRAGSYSTTIRFDARVL